jgi:hypothetical protein
MPPTGPLAPDQIRILKAWIDQGAAWPDDLSGEVPVPPVDNASDALAELIRLGDRTAIERRVRETPGATRGRTAGGATPLMFAALYGDAALMRRLLEAGVDASAATPAGATALMWAVPHVDRMQLLIASGADVKARSQDGRTALLIAAGIVGAAPAVRLLLEHGASPASSVRGDTTPLREAARIDDPETFRLLLDHGADATAVPADFLRVNCHRCAVAAGVGADGRIPRPEPPDTGLRPNLEPPARASRVAADEPTAAAIDAAVQRSLPLLQRVAVPFIRKTGCVSCHHDSVVAMAVDAARRHGYRVDDAADAELRRVTADYLESWRDRTLQNRFIAGQQDTISYLLLGLAASGHPPDRATDTQALWLLRRQAADGQWPIATIRPPIESNSIAVTALSMRAVQRYAPPSMRAEAEAAVTRARRWLERAAGSMTEQRVFRALGLTWARADRGAVAKAADELLALQRDDGGWGQEPSMLSDAYATGEALFALEESGVISKNDRRIRRGLAYLVRSQLEDGSWYVTSRSVAIQPYFESSFPHATDQWISAAATAWSVMALAGSR